jgi:chemotaxis protein methyltransferase WspC
LVATRLGLDAESLGPSAFPRAVTERMASLGLTCRESYAQVLSSDPVEWATLTAGLVVPETWFFRGGRPLFDHLAKWLAERTNGLPVRVLSVPCSTGEEPYSLAIALHDRGLPPAAYRIDAADVSPDAVARAAAAARYTTFAFRDPGPDPRPAAFHKAGDRRWELCPEIRDRVQFRVGNVTDPVFLAGERPYDLIICRNLFIYLTPAARDRVVANFDRLLTANGLLCVTPAEADRLPAERFAADEPAGFGLFKRARSGGIAPVGRAEPSRPDSRTVDVGRAPARSDRPPPVLASDLEESARPTLTTDTLTTARRLADGGRLDDALAACERIIAAGSTADGFGLLGVIQLARGAADAAAAAFRRALYLDPDHYESLTHMIVLCYNRGDAAQAAALRRRLARAAREDES